jgi:hypothetical protein
MRYGCIAVSVSAGWWMAPLCLAPANDRLEPLWTTSSAGASVVADDVLCYQPTGDWDTNTDGRCAFAVLAARTLDLEATIGSPHELRRVFVRWGRAGHGGAR